jgi:hypothetical protein
MKKSLLERNGEEKEERMRENKRKKIGLRN